MNKNRNLFSVCIPAYNRVHHLGALLDSILDQSFTDYEIVICEDMSRQRTEIEALVREYQTRHPDVLRYFENEVNLGYDGNIRTLVEKSEGRFCFFMGNDDLMCPNALETVAGAIQRHPDVGVVLKGYATFEENPANLIHQIRWFREETEIEAGRPAIRFAFRRSGVISGYVVDRDTAVRATTDKFDGTLYYQMHLTANVLVDKIAVGIPEILVLCRGIEPPDFGNSDLEKGTYVPGGYTPQARLSMVGGALSIIRDLKQTRGIDVEGDVTRDYANYFYPYIKDQLELSPRALWKLYRDFGRMGFSRYPLFHFYFAVGYILGEKRFDSLAGVLRKVLGRSPRF